MKRKPLISPEAANCTAAKNEILNRFPIPFQTAFNDVPMPKARLDTYVPRRAWKDESEYGASGEENAYEKYLHRIFWEYQSYPERLIFIEGDVGCGKSTLVQYYLQEYCPRENKDKFTEKLILNIDLRHVVELGQLSNMLFRMLRQTITACCQDAHFDLIFHNGGAMWNSVFDWESELFKGISVERKKELVQEHLAKITDIDWVSTAIEYFSILMTEEKGKLPFRFIVLCLDNLDQSPYPVQSHVLKTVATWLSRKSPFWRVFIPLWPTTCEELLQDAAPLPPFRRVKVGPPDSGEVFRKRSEYVAELIQDEAGGETIHFHEPDDDTTIELSSSDLRQFVTKALSAAPRDFIGLLAALSGDSTRRYLKLWHTVLESKALHVQYFGKATRKDPLAEHGTDDEAFKNVYYYSWFEALCTGHCDYHNRSEHPLPNLFWTASSSDDYRDPLIGVHALHTIVKTDCNRVDDLWRELAPLGYSRQKIAEALNYFSTKELLRWRDLSNKNEFFPSIDLMKSALLLLEIPAYHDTIALTTPLPPERSRFLIETKSSDNTQFRARVNSTLHFLAQIHDDEQDFAKVKGNTNPDRDKFKEAMYHLDLPSITDIMVQHYKRRLLKLRNSTIYLKHLSASEWGTMFRHPVLSHDAIGNVIRPLE